VITWYSLGVGGEEGCPGRGREGRAGRGLRGHDRGGLGRGLERELRGGGNLWDEMGLMGGWGEGAKEDIGSEEGYVRGIGT
jgi:hypothetical protein